MNRREVLRVWGRAGVGLAALAVAGPPVGPVRTVAAAGQGCQETARGGVVAAVGPDGRLAELPAPFGSQPWASDSGRLLWEARESVAAELAGVGAPDCFAARLPTIAERTALL